MLMDRPLKTSGTIGRGIDVWWDSRWEGPTADIATTPAGTCRQQQQDQKMQAG